MAELVRLRQICLVASHLEPVIADIAGIMGLNVCYRDGNVAKYGLENALLPVDTILLEVVAPFQPGTAAGRFSTRPEAAAATWRSSAATILMNAGGMLKKSASASPTSSNTRPIMVCNCIRGIAVPRSSNSITRKAATTFSAPIRRRGRTGKNRFARMSRKP